jgi:predicted permease
MQKLLRRLWYLLNRRRMEHEMAEEMDWHRDQLPPGRRSDFGSGLRLREDAREVWGWAWLDRARQDVAYGVRILRRSPGFTLTAMLVLSLGIAVPVTAFRAMLASLSGGNVPDPDSLVRLTRRAPGMLNTVLPYPELAFYAANAQSFRNVIGTIGIKHATFGEPAPGRESEEISLFFVTANYFPEFGVRAIRGRVPSAADELPDAEPVAMLGNLFWQRRLGGDPAIVGQTVRVSGKPLRVVGILPRSTETNAAVWIPLVREPYIVEGSTLLTNWETPLDLYARLKPGVTPEAAAQETRAVAAKLREIRPGAVHKGEYLDARPIQQLESHGSQFAMAVTAGALVTLLLVVACANLGTLMLARGARREREIRTRMALGAGRRRLVRQLFTEALLLAILSGAAGLLLSSVVLKLFILQSGPASVPSVLPDWRTIALTVTVALLSAVVFGLPPAFRLTSAAPSAGRSRTIFLAVQMAASCLLLFTSSLLVHGLERLAALDPGFDYQHLVWIAPGLKAHGYAGPSAHAYFDALGLRAGELPGVLSTSEAATAPWSGGRWSEGWNGRDYAGNHVDPRYLETLGLRLVRGRNFAKGEDDVALLSESAARSLWPDANPLGKTLPWGAHNILVIGIVRNASTMAVADPDPLEFYLPQTPAETPGAVLLVRLSGRPRDSIRRLQDAARALDRRLQPSVQAVADAHDRVLDNLSRVLAIIATLGTVAILLAAIGLAGLAGYSVAQRTRELGVRIALGAQSPQIVRAVFAPMSRPVAIGSLCGAFGATAVMRILRSGLPGIGGLDLLDPRAYLLAMAFFALVIALAVAAPARRAVRIQPSRALQHE